MSFKRQLIPAMILASATLLVSAESARAAVVFWTGEQVRLEYDLAGSTTYDWDAEFSVDDGVEATHPLTGADFDFSPNLLVISYPEDVDSEGVVYGDSEYRILDYLGEIEDFTQVEVDTSTSLGSRFEPSRIEVSDDMISLDFAGVEYFPDDSLRLLVNGGPAAVPEPGSLAFLGICGFGVAASRRRGRERIARLLRRRTAAE